MKNIYGNLFYPKTYLNQNKKPIDLKPDAICITTNGFVKKNGEAVMGRGCAAQAAKLIPELPRRLGHELKHGPNIPNNLGSLRREINIVSFPVKPEGSLCSKTKSNVVKHMRNKFYPGDYVPGWACIASYSLIQDSANHLKFLADEYLWKCIVIPRPGVGYGELEWNKVKPILENILDDRFYVITFPNDPTS